MLVFQKHNCLIRWLIDAQKMTHLLLLGLQVEMVVLGRRNLDWHTINDLESEIFELVNLVRIVREQAHRLHTQAP